MANKTTITIEDVILHLARFKGSEKEFVKEARKLLCDAITKEQYETLDKRCQQLESKLHVLEGYIDWN